MSEPVKPVRPMRTAAPIVPPGNVAGSALVFVIAIMTFLSCLTLGAVTMIRTTAAGWQSQIAREATIQIRPAGPGGELQDMEAALEKARDIALSFEGVAGAEILDRDATARLLEPWLGTGLDLEELPVPRLVIVTIDEGAPPDFAAMRIALTAAVPNASLDDHRTWVDRLVSMAGTTVTIGLGILALMLAATVTTVVFATRGAMSGNGHIIEVLHFVGAEPGFIASQFRRHFLMTGLRGALAGGGAALVLFVALAFWLSKSAATPEADQTAAMFGSFALGIGGYAGIAAIVALVTGLTAITSHLAVLRWLRDIEHAAADH